MIGKSIINAKNIICLCTALVLGAGFIWANKNVKEEPEPVKPASTQDTEAAKPQPEAAKSQPEAADGGRLAPSIPEYSCQFIRFDDDRALFVNVEGNYSFMEYGLYPDELTVTSDNAEKVTIAADKGNVTMTCNGEDVEFFVYEGHVISLRDNKLYYDESPVERKIDTFSAYQLNDDCVIECIDRRNYRLRDKDGKITHKTKITDVSGLELEVTANENGFRALDEDDLYYPVLKLNGDLVETAPDMTIHVNGCELLPIGANDRYVDPDAKLNTDGAIAPTKPVDRGSIRAENEGVKEITYEMLEYVNEARSQYGFEHLYGLQSLDEAAQVRAEELTKDFSHKRGEDKSFSSSIDSIGTWWHCGECIITHDTTSAHEVFEKLMDSEENRALLLDPRMKYLAATFSEKDGVYYWDILMYNDTYMPAES